MRFSENRVIAWIVLAVCVLGSIFGLGGAAVAREQARIEKVFYTGADDRDISHCMDAYLKRAGECAGIMANEAALLAGSNADTEALLAAVAFIGSDDSMQDRAAAFREMCSLSDRLYNAVYAANLSENQRRNFKLAYDDFWGTARFIEKDPYHELARDYNNKLTGLAALAGKLHGAGILCDTFI